MRLLLIALLFSCSESNDAANDAANAADGVSPPPESADVVFAWNNGAKVSAGTRAETFPEDFWGRGINCGGDPAEFSDTTRVTFGVDNIVRFAGSRSVEFFTDRSKVAQCNQHTVAHRAEMNVNDYYRKHDKQGNENQPTLGVQTGSPGSSVWIGWSEYYSEIALEDATTMLQIRSNCGTGSPAVSLVYRPDGPYQKPVGIFLKTYSQNGPPADNFQPVTPLAAGAWRDFVIEVRYGYTDATGHIKLWHAAADANTPPSFEYEAPNIYRQSATLFGEDAPLPANADKEDNCPHLRWGLYRHDGSDVPPEQIDPSERKMVKYVGPVRIHVGDIGPAGLAAVIPRRPN